MTAKSLLKTAEEVAQFYRGMSIDIKTDRWRRLGGIEQNTLFPIREVIPYAPATEDDRLILSGAAGLSLVNFRHRCSLLARSRFEDYGFQTFNEACAFVGAYVVGKLVNADRRWPKEKEPSFSYVQNGVIHTLSVGGSFHGDFRMSETQIPEADILSPINTITEFRPQRTLDVAGYHSIEPDIVASLIEAEFLRAGEKAASNLVHEFIKTLDNETDEAGNIQFRSGAFADYGDGDVWFSLRTLEQMIMDKDYSPLRRDGWLHSSRYLPQSSTMFEIVPTDEGVKFQNRDEKYAGDVRGIRVNREFYTDLFRSLVRQTSGGLGRTSPSQIIQLVYGAKDLLEHKFDSDRGFWP